MFSIKQNTVKLVQRNEGKIKSYESCADVRSWSHDSKIRDRYLRDWIKSDMPFCVIPINTVSRALRIMSWRRREKVAPRCHPECKSKVVLESIYNSCHAIKECFKENEKFTKYFEEEEFETSHWPCDRCLDALKSIRLFWTIILEKIFKVKFPIDSEMNTRLHGQNVKSLATAWQKDLIEQAIFVKNISPFINDQLNSKSNSSLIAESKHESSNTIFRKKPNKEISTDTDFIIYNARVKRRRSKSLCKKLSRCTSVRIKTANAVSETCDIDNEEINSYRNNLDYLQQQYNLQKDELKRLERENMSLKLELRYTRNNSVPSYTPVLLSDSKVIVAPTPFESYYGGRDTDRLNDIESEMVITLKNYKNKNFRNVSMLQVLHKTNSITNDNFNNTYLKKREDPIEVLTRVHNTFGAIVEKELTIANEKKTNTKNINDIHQRIYKEKYDRHCSSKSSHCTISDANFVSTTEVLY